MCAAAAEGVGCDAIVSRDPKGFQKSPVRVLEPRAALLLLRQNPPPLAEPKAEFGGKKQAGNTRPTVAVGRRR